MECTVCKGKGTVRYFDAIQGWVVAPCSACARLGDRVLYHPRAEDPVSAGGPFLALVVGLWPEGQVELEVFVPAAVAVREWHTRNKRPGVLYKTLDVLLRWRRDGVSAGKGPGCWSPLEAP